MTDADIVVIGAGPAGLAVSACLRRAGLGHLMVEREATVASSWRRHYDRLHLHTAKQYSALPFAPWPRAAPRYPSRDQVVAYLSSYALEHAVAPRFGVDVRRIARHEGRFVIDTGAGSLSPRFVVVATGHNAVARPAGWPGLDGFGGTLMQARDYRRPEPFIGRRTLVVGAGHSGMEIALDLAEQGVDVGLVVRGPVHVVPRDLFGLPSQQIAVWLSRLPMALRDGIATPVVRRAVGDLARWGIVRPRAGIGRVLAETGRVPLLDIGTVAMIKAGRIRVLPAVESARGSRLRFAGGEELPFDAIVMATGYVPGLERFIAGFDAIADARGRPDRFGAEGAIPGLFFVGFNSPLTGVLREIGIEARRVAAALKGLAGD